MGIRLRQNFLVLRTMPAACRTFGCGGTSRCRAGSETTCTFRWNFAGPQPAAAAARCSRGLSGRAMCCRSLPQRCVARRKLDVRRLGALSRGPARGRAFRERYLEVPRRTQTPKVTADKCAFGRADVRACDSGVCVLCASSIREALAIFWNIGTDWRSFLTPERVSYEAVRVGWERWDTIVIALSLAALEIGDTFGQRFSWRERLAREPAPVRWTAYYALVLTIVLCGQFGGAPFIYFQF